MALHWTPKAAADVREYRWTLPDSIDTIAVVVSSGTATVVATTEGVDAVFTVTGGVAGAVQQFALTAVVDTETFTETAYLPIRVSSDALGNTAHDVCAFALRKIFGAGEEPPAEAAEDALERLNDMLAAWVGQGADIGIILPLKLTDAMKVSDAFLSAIKNNLILQVADLYGMDVSPVVVANARSGLQLVKTALVPIERGNAEYF